MKRYGQYSLQFQQFGGAAFGLPYGTATPSTGVGANVLRSRVNNQPLRSRETNQLLTSRAA